MLCDLGKIFLGEFLFRVYSLEISQHPKYAIHENLYSAPSIVKNKSRYSIAKFSILVVIDSRVFSTTIFQVTFHAADEPLLG